MEPTKRLGKLFLAGGVAMLLGFALTSGNQALAQGSCVAPPSGLIGWWDADSVSGTTATDIKGGNDGTMLGGVTIDTSVKVGDAFSFDGNVYQRIQLPFGSGDISTNQFTVDAWAFPTKTTPHSFLQSIIEDDDAMNIGVGRGIGLGFSGGVPFWWQGQFFPNPFRALAFVNMTDNSQFFATAITNPNEWHHYASTYDGTELCLYIDGVPTCTATTGVLNDNGVNFKIAGNEEIPQNGYYFQGEIDEVEIFDRALTVTEIQAIFNAGSAGKCKTFEADILVEPEDVVDFGQIDTFTTKDAIVTISNTGGADLTVNGVAVTAGDTLFSITDWDPPEALPTPFTLLPGDDVFVTITFFPTSEGTHIGTLTVDSDDPDELIIDVSLIGNGLVGAVEDQATVLEAAVDDAILDFGLVGSGSGNSADGRLGAFANMIEAAGDLIEAGFIEDACEQLRSALRRVDGNPRPPDFVTGDDAPLIAEQIVFLRDSLECS